jgi:Na+/melibiose symporter-like transporter
VLLSTAAGALGIAGFIFRELHTDAPMLPLKLFRSRNFSAANGATLALYAIFNGNFFILTIYLQTTLGYSALAAGLATLPVTLFMIGLASRSGRLAARTGPRLPMTVGILLTGAGLGLPGIVLFGLGLVLTVPPLTNTAVSSVPDSQTGIASGVNDEAARVAALLGVAVIGLVFAEFRVLQAASINAYQAAMMAGVVIAVMGALVAFLGIRNPRSSPPSAAEGPYPSR